MSLVAEKAVVASIRRDCEDKSSGGQTGLFAAPRTFSCSKKKLEHKLNGLPKPEHSHSTVTGSNSYYF